MIGWNFRGNQDAAPEPFTRRSDKYPQVTTFTKCHPIVSTAPTQSMSAPENEGINELSENDREYEMVYNQLMERRKTSWDQKIKEAEEFHREHKKKAGERKVNKNHSGLNAERKKNAEETEREFDERLHAYLTAMEKCIPSAERDVDLSPVTDGTKGQVDDNSEDIMDTRDSSATSHSSPEYLPAPALPADPERLSAQGKHEEDEEYKEAAPEALHSLPIPQYTDRVFKPETVASASPPASVHTGAQIRVNRVPSERIPSSLGLSEYGLHPHATVWTRAPAWAQTSVAVGMGAAFAGLGYGIFKLIGKLFDRKVAKERSRLHARDWDIKI